MKLTEFQIQELYTFTQKKGIKYIDLQDELVDHLICAIEDELSKDPTLTFETVFKSEYKKFGIFGFDGVLMDRTVQLEKKAYRLFFKHFIQFFKIPKLFFTISLFLGIYYLMTFSNLVEVVYYGVGLTALAIMLYNIHVLFNDVKDKSRKYLIASQYHLLTRLSSSIFYWILIFPLTVTDGTLMENLYVSSAMLTFVVLVVLISRAQLENLKTYMEETYPVSA